MTDTLDLRATAARIHAWGREAGFQAIAITDTDAGRHARALERWLQAGHHGEMAFMAAHGAMRWRPEALLPGTRRVISVRLDYLPDSEDPQTVLDDSRKGYVARYALGRDYHKLMRKRLARLAERIDAELAPHRYRALVDSAPVLERGFAEKAGLGWIGKNSMLINSRAGSWFFLGEIYTDLPLPVDAPQETGHCGSCNACMTACPTGAIVAPGEVDARRCISYLTIELKGSIPERLRPLIGNRIYGCDDCQLVCPWNKFAQPSAEADFQPRNGLEGSQLVDLFAWDEATFEARTAGSPIRRIGYQRWLRNIAVALGNAPADGDVIAALQARADDPSPLVREHTRWALEHHGALIAVQR